MICRFRLLLTIIRISGIECEFNDKFEDNVVIDVRLEAITKLKRDFEMNDIPIIGGFAALKIRFLETHLYRIDIPQVKSSILIRIISEKFFFNRRNISDPKSLSKW